MAFDVAADAYDRFMGRYSRLLAPQLADFAAVRAGQRAVDVGSGPGALTGELVRRLGADAVSAVDPSASFIAAAGARHPGVTVRQASAEELPFADAAFDVAIAQLVVHFMTDPLRGIGEMRRVTRPGGTVAACVWDLAGGRAPISLFWSAVRELHGEVVDESELPGVRRGHLGELFVAAGMRDVIETELSVSLEHPTFEEWWAPYAEGVGPAGAYLARLEPSRRDEVRDGCRARLPDAPFTLTAVAWAATGLA
ncbi:MAG: methyltransferase domain-containing protein [Chloroflexota bacterium]